MTEDLLPIADCLAVIDQLGKMERAQLREGRTERLRAEFAQIVDVDLKFVDRFTFIAALGLAVSSRRIGWWRESGEAPHFFEDDCFGVSCDRAVETPENSKGDHPRFRYKRKSFDESSFVAFDEWLGKQQLRTRAKRIKSKPAVAVNSEMIRNRVVLIDSQSEPWLAVVHPVSEIPKLIEMLDGLGFRAWRVLGDTDEERELWSIPDTRTLDVAIGYLTHSCGFELVVRDESKRTGVVRKWVDDEHGVTVSISEQKDTSQVLFGLVRRDIHELFAKLIPGEADDAQPTVSKKNGKKSPYPPAPLAPGWGVFAGRDEVVAFLDEWVPQFEAIANYSFIAADLETVRKGGTYSHPWGLIINRMLNGWQPKYDDKLLKDDLKVFGPLVAMIAQLNGDLGATIRQGISQVRLWIEAHPDGIDRQLI